MAAARLIILPLTACCWPLPLLVSVQQPLLDVGRATIVRHERRDEETSKGKDARGKKRGGREKEGRARRGGLDREKAASLRREWTGRPPRGAETEGDEARGEQLASVGCRWPVAADAKGGAVQPSSSLTLPLSLPQATPPKVNRLYCTVIAHCTCRACVRVITACTGGCEFDCRAASIRTARCQNRESGSQKAGTSPRL